MSRIRRLLVASIVVAAACGTFALAQDAAPARPWTNTAEFGFVMTTGNSETQNFKFSNKFVYKFPRLDLEIDALALRAEQTTRTVTNDEGVLVVSEVDETNAEAYGLGGRIRVPVNERFFWYTGLSWARNRFAGIDSRYVLGAGVGYVFFQNDRNKLRGEAGGEYVDETYIDGTIPPDANFAAARGFLGYELTLSETAKFTQELEVNQNLDESDDLRARSETAIVATLTRTLALKASYTVLFDNEPVVETISAPGFDDVFFEFDDVDTILAMSLVINF